MGSSSENFFYVIMRIDVLEGDHIVVFSHNTYIRSCAGNRSIARRHTPRIQRIYSAIQMAYCFGGNILSKIKKRKAAIVYIIITAIMFANSAVGFFVEKRDWIVTAAIVENIDWTEETYFGSYISKSGEIRENVEFCPFYGSPYGIFDFAYKPLVNNEILIHYDPSTVSVYPEYDYFVLCDSEIYFSEMADLILSAVLFVASLVFLVLNIKPKVSKTDAQSGSNDKIQSSAIDSADIINN